MSTVVHTKGFQTNWLSLAEFNSPSDRLTYISLSIAANLAKDMWIEAQNKVAYSQAAK